MNILLLNLEVINISLVNNTQFILQYVNSCRKIPFLMYANILSFKGYIFIALICHDVSFEIRILIYF